MELERRKKANDAVRYGASSFCEAVRRREFGLGQLVEPSAGLHQKSFILHSPQIDSGYAHSIEVAGTRNPLLADEGKRSGLQC